MCRTTRTIAALLALILMLGLLSIGAAAADDRVEVETIAFTSPGGFAPEVGKPLCPSLTVQTNPEGGAPAQVPVQWEVCSPMGVVSQATGTVKAGQVYYRPQFSLSPEAGFKFYAAGAKTFLLNGQPMPTSMLLMLTRNAELVRCDRYYYYGIVTLPTEHGTIFAPDYAAGTDTVSLTAQPDEGYDLVRWEVTNQLGAIIEVSADNTFRMPFHEELEGSVSTLKPVTVKALFAPHQHTWDSGRITKEPTETAAGVKTYTCTVCGETRTETVPKKTPKPDPKPMENPFVDVKSGDYFFDPVLWALNHDPQITDGTSETTFSPKDTCTRGQVVTFLWRAMGCKEPTRTDNPFTDVKSSDYFYKAVLWAVEKGITDGTSATTFSPADPCTRAHVVTFLWRAENKPAAGSNNPFTDVARGQYYYDAVLWAVSKAITDGTSDTTFSPTDPCTRGQIVTFLYRDMQ